MKAKREHPKWGALKLIQFLERKGHKVPAVSTANDLLKRHGLVNRRPQHGQLKSRGTELGPFDAPNAIWCADYKGQFQLGNRSWCYPLTVTDGFSRFFLLCQGMPAIVLEPTKASFERLFRERGLPDAIRTDNGMPFGSSGAAGLSRLSVWWLKLGIRIERIVPGRPQQNGRHERVHRTLQEHTGDEPENDLPTQQIRFDRFLCEFNFERPHQALDGKTPSDLYRPACREFPRVLETPGYPGHHALRRIRHDGSFHWQGSNLFLGDAFSGETVGFEEFDDDRWLIRYAGVELAVLDGRGNKPKVHRLPIQRTVLGTVQGKLAALAPSAPWTAPARRG